jgi:hypothetical protein
MSKLTDGQQFALGVIAIVVILYLASAWTIAVNNTSEMYCAKGLHASHDALTLGATGRCVK